MSPRGCREAAALASQERLRTIDRRQINEHRRYSFGEPGRLIAFVCECADEACRETVLLTPEDYDAARPRPIVRPGHAQASAA